MTHWTSLPDDTAEADTEDASAVARDAVRIRLRDCECAQEPAGDDAEARYRRTLERALGGAVEVCAALRAYQMACDNEPDELDAEDRALAQAWMKASQRATADGLGGLEGADEAWFEVTARKVAALPRKPMPRPPAVAPAVAVAPVVSHSPYVRPPAAELPTDLFPTRGPAAPMAAACEKAPARTRTRTKIAEPVPSPQFELF